MGNTSTKFKVGDRVRCLKDSHACGFIKGEVYTVGGLELSHDRVAIVEDSLGSRTNGWLADCFELATDSPIRTVTRREIVQYTMNAGGGEGTPEIQINPTYGRAVDVTVGAAPYGARFNVASLRTAARVFNEIADALDDAGSAA